MAQYARQYANEHSSVKRNSQFETMWSAAETEGVRFHFKNLLTELNNTLGALPIMPGRQGKTAEDLKAEGFDISKL